MRKLLVFTIIILCSLQACAQPEAGMTAELVADSTQLLHDLRVLSADSMEGRQTGTEGNRKAREYIINRFKKIGLTAYAPGYLQEFDLVRKNHQDMRAVPDTVSGYNLLGFVQGESDSVIVISAHYDHIGAQGDKIYNGADDNASGVAVLLAMAEYFTSHKPDHTLIFAAFDAEEAGLEGAKYFMNSLEVDPSRMVLNVNMDMVSQNTKNELFASGTRYTPTLKAYLEKAAKDSGITIRYGHDGGKDGLQNWTYSSDHAPFHKAGIPFIYFGVDDHPHYHKPTDTFERVPLPFFYKTANYILRAVILLDQSLGDMAG